MVKIWYHNQAWWYVVDEGDRWSETHGPFRTFMEAAEYYDSFLRSP